MQKMLRQLIQHLDDPSIARTNVIKWGAPVPSFGDFRKAKVATLGLNPSNREFVDTQGAELSGHQRRFHTLQSLNLAKWADVKNADLKKIIDSCENYFLRNPYEGWFRSLDNLISGTRFSYYDKKKQACHLDLIPYATEQKWTALTTSERLFLLELSADPLGMLLKKSPIHLVILNGRTVVKNLEKVAGVKFAEKVVEEWTLPRKRGEGVLGISYRGVIQNVGNISLDREVHILGYNHNLQSSFGVTNSVRYAMRKWIENSSGEIFS